MPRFIAFLIVLIGVAQVATPAAAQREASTAPPQPAPATECAPAPTDASSPPADSVAPAISSIQAVYKRLFALESQPIGTSRRRPVVAFRYAISEPATVSFCLVRKRTGHRVGTFVASAQTGTNTHKIPRSLSARLGKGRYIAELLAQDVAGNRSVPAQTAFRLGRRR